MSENVIQNEPSVITLKDGTKFKGDCGNDSYDNLWLWITTDTPLINVAVVFSDPTKTEVIHYDRTEFYSADYEGYTKLTSINHDKSGKISIRLEK